MAGDVEKSKVVPTRFKKGWRKVRFKLNRYILVARSKKQRTNREKNKEKIGKRVTEEKRERLRDLKWHEIKSIRLTIFFLFLGCYQPFPFYSSQKKKKIVLHLILIFILKKYFYYLR